MAETFEIEQLEEKVILVGVSLQDEKETEESLEELRELADTAGAVTVGKVIQNREAVHPGTYIGSGKADEQTQAIMCLAAGGLFGLGAGNGELKYIFAADSDIVFCTVCEEWGLIVGVLTVVCIVVLAVFVLRSCVVGRSSFYAIGACAAVTILTVQTMLNVLGTMDILPLTGVTFPFVSNGGSSMLCSWGLLAFIKAADTRQNASLAVKSASAGEVEQYE